MSYINLLVQLTEKDKRLLVALFIAFIILFVLIAYIGQGIKSLMKKYSKGIDGYMHELCSNKLVTNPRCFRRQVWKREVKTLYYNTRWVFRVFVLSMALFVAYSLIVKPGGSENPFGYVGHYLGELMIDLEWPKSEFFGIKNFPVDWPYVAKGSQVYFEVASIVSYVMLIIWVATFFCLFASTLKFIARVHRGVEKSTEVFTRSLDDATFIED